MIMFDRASKLTMQGNSMVFIISFLKLRKKICHQMEKVTKANKSNHISWMNSNCLACLPFLCTYFIVLGLQWKFFMLLRFTIEYSFFFFYLLYSSNNTFTGILKRIPLHYNLWGKNVCILMMLRFFKDIKIDTYYWSTLHDICYEIYKHSSFIYCDTQNNSFHYSLWWKIICSVFN